MYTRVWSSVCDEMHVAFEQNLLHYVLTKMYPGSDRPLLACHPRDLICMALDKASYDERGGRLEIDDLRWAWANYFLPIDDRGAAAPRR
jgi:hypothetical protein